MWTIEGKNVIVTGANTGIGRATAAGLASARARVVFACRSRAKTEAVIEAIARETGNGALSFLEVDLADLASVRDGARRFLDRGEPLHVLVNNAGLSSVRGLTAQGFELTFGVNHLGHFLLTQLLMPALRQGAPSRLVVVGSRAHERARGVDFDPLRHPASGLLGWPEYMQSKLCNTLFAKEAARRLDPEVTRVYVVHPGVIGSDIWRSTPWPLSRLLPRLFKSAEEGARSSLLCATSDEVSTHHGRYYDEDGSERRLSPVAEDPALAARLWAQSEAWVKPFLGETPAPGAAPGAHRPSLPSGA